MSDDRNRSVLAGRTILITGATSGIGRATAKALAGRGATVILGARNADRGEATRNEITNTTGNPSVEVRLADLSSQHSIHRLAQAVIADHEQLHVLINNAGVINPRRRETTDGLEETLAINHLAPFLLTHLLLPTMRASGPARVITVSSAAQAMGRIDLDDLQSSRRYSQQRAYNQSKLANVLFTYELARRLEVDGADGPGGLSATALEPGFVRTAMRPPFPFSLFAALSTSADTGARASVALAGADRLDTDNGFFFDRKGNPTRTTPVSYDTTLAGRLWNISAQLTTHTPSLPDPA
ncbi:SDR family oxidoreductase [Streptomyces sp. NBC_00690]|uniref:SDR family oxidoreductase n=1 Tax=Streptomyces sp. NBC_00690 TaxID=2975808 RepID=UPI002E27E559|nr:SDR family oxidoreductase [Streptomyces sp. NBC_00690]